MNLLKKQFVKYWPSLTYMAILTLLFFYLIPGAESRYLKEDLYLIEKKTKLIVLIIAGVLAASAIYFAARNAEGLKNAVSILGAGIGVFMIFCLVLRPFIVYILLLLNFIPAKQSVQRKYIFAASTVKNGAWLLENDSNSSLTSLEFPGLIDSTVYHPGDTVTLVFKKGILGVCYSPQELVSKSRKN